MSVKIERINEMLIEEISKIIALEVKDKDINFVTITDAKVVSDLSYAKIYFTCLDESKIKETTKALNNASGFIRSELHGRIHIRYIPKLEFIYDESIKQGKRIEQIIEELNN
jgi:ribosome-binding factor A